MPQSETIKGGGGPDTNDRVLAARERNCATGASQRHNELTGRTRSPLKIMREKIRSLSNYTPRTSKMSIRDLLTPRESFLPCEHNHTDMELTFPWRRDVHWNEFTPRGVMSQSTTPRRHSGVAGYTPAQGRRRVLVPGSVSPASATTTTEASNCNQSSPSLCHHGISRGLEEPLIQPLRVGSTGMISPSRDATSTLNHETSPRRHSVYVDKLPDSVVSNDSAWRVFHSTVLTPRSTSEKTPAVSPPSARRKSPIRPRGQSCFSKPDAVTFKLNAGDIQEILDSVPGDSLAPDTGTPQCSPHVIEETSPHMDDRCPYIAVSQHITVPPSRQIFASCSGRDDMIQEGKKGRKKKEVEIEKVAVEPLPVYKQVFLSPEGIKIRESDSTTPHSGINGSHHRSESPATSTPRSDVAPSYVPLDDEDVTVRSSAWALRHTSFTPNEGQEKEFTAPLFDTVTQKERRGNGKLKEPIPPYRISIVGNPPGSMEPVREEVLIQCHFGHGESGLSSTGNSERSKNSLTSDVQTNGVLSMKLNVEGKDDLPTLSGSCETGAASSDIPLTRSDVGECTENKTDNNVTVKAHNTRRSSGWSHSVLQEDTTPMSVLLPSPDSIVHTLVGR